MPSPVASSYHPPDDCCTYSSAETAADQRHDGGSVQLAQWLRETGDGVHAVGVEQGWALRFVFPVERRMQWFIDAAGDFQDLVTMAVGQTADSRAS